MSFVINVEKVENNASSNFTLNGSRTLYEETYDGTHAGWNKFRKDIMTEGGFQSTDFLLEGKQGESWIKLENVDQFEPFLDEAVNNGEMTIRVTIKSSSKKDKSKKTSKKNEIGNKATNSEDLEAGKSEQDTNDDKKSGKSSGCNPCKFAILLVLFVLLFGFWVVGLVVVLVIELFWLPFKCLCPCLCPCICCIEGVEKKAFALVFFVLKLPLRLIKHVLH